jgi:hypothetical protein
MQREASTKKLLSKCRLSMGDKYSKKETSLCIPCNVYISVYNDFYVLVRFTRHTVTDILRVGSLYPQFGGPRGEQ